MPKTTKEKIEETKSLEQEKMEAAQKAEQEAQEAVAKDVEKILVDAGYALKPFLVYREEGISPSVRLVKVEKKDK